MDLKAQARAIAEEIFHLREKMTQLGQRSLKEGSFRLSLDRHDVEAKIAMAGVDLAGVVMQMLHEEDDDG